MLVYIQRCVLPLLDSMFKYLYCSCI